MRYRNMKTGDERDFVQGMKFDDLWKPVHKLHTGGRSTVTVTEIHPEDMQADMNKTIMGEDKAPEKKSRRKASIVKSVEAAKRKEAAELKAKKAKEAEITS